MRTGRNFLATTCLTLLFAAGAQSQNLVPNPGLDHDLSGWTFQAGSAAWSSLDANGSVFSGSLALTPPEHGSGQALSGCFPAAPGAYAMGYKSYIPTAGLFSVGGFLRWYSDSSCGLLLNNSLSFIDFFHGAWSTVDTRFSGLDAIAPPGTQSAAMQLIATGGPAQFDDVIVQREGACVSNTCLNQGRFAVDIRWIKDNMSGQGRQVSRTADSATYWFFDPNNIELIVKVLNGCESSGHYWVFMAGLTDVHVDVSVIDVATGATRTYVNQQGTAFQPIQDTAAFPCS